MKLGLLITGALCLPLSVLAQEKNDSQNTSETLVTSVLADGSPSKSSQKKSSPKFKIKWATQTEQGGRKVTMSEVETPILGESQQIQRSPKLELSEEEIAELLRQHSNGVSSHFLVVSAMIFDERATRLRLSSYSEGKEELVEAWSNVDWNYLSGFPSFEGRGRQFYFVLVHANSSLKSRNQIRRKNPKAEFPEIPQSLPNLSAKGPHYLVTQEGSGSETALEFLEVIHDLYAAEEKSLKQAFRKREQQRKERAEELLRSPPKPKDIEIRFWNNDVNKK